MKDKYSDSIIRLQHIENAIERIQKYVADEDRLTFCSKTLVHDAVLFQFTVMGEAINHIDSDLLDKYSYPWYKVRSFRNFIAHEYFSLKLPAVWQIIEDELPGLKTVIQTMIETEF
jgi:uncharacterized protein with HEPN domain